MLTHDQIVTAGAQMGVALSAEQAAQLSQYALLLQEWNERFNLTGIVDDEGILTRHICDSLSVLQVLPPTARTLIDVGTGAGFPGLVLKIAKPGLLVTLMDSTGKKVAFCQAVIDALKLMGVRALKERADDAALTPTHREQYDVATARAVAAMNTLSEYLLPFVRVRGCAIALKGADADAELATARNAIKHLGGQLNRVHKVTLPGLPDARALIVIDKVSPTIAKYPRPTGLPRTRPL
jgi:16S rRNA (guanine527-N7)-methyltransferase